MNIVSSRFNLTAKNYLKSRVHSSGKSIRLAQSLLSLTPEDIVCDVGCGAGHFGLSLASRGNRVVGIDPSYEMLRQFSQLASTQGVASESICSSAENIPLADHSVPLVVSRLAAHHFSNIEFSIREMARICQDDGIVMIVDLEGYDDFVVDQLNHELEVLHDPSHVRSYSPSSWEAVLSQVGLEIVNRVQNIQEIESGISVQNWCDISRTTKDSEKKIYEKLRKISPRQLDQLGVWEYQNEFFISVKTCLWIAKKSKKGGLYANY